MLALVPTRYIVQNLLQVPAHNDIIAYTDEHLRHLNKAQRILVWLRITARTSSK